MTSDEKYLFDLNGYLVVENVLTPEEVAVANEGIERHLDRMTIRAESLADSSPALVGERGRNELYGLQAWEEPYGSLFRRLLAPPRIVPHLHEILGPGFRIDHYMFLLQMERGTEGFSFHGASGPGFDPNQYYIFRDGRIYCGLTVVSLQLTDVNPGDGGFAVVPGSHKCNFCAPRALTRYEGYREHVRQVACRAGSAIIFTEAVTHGTLPWIPARPRRSLLTRYTRANMAYVPAQPAPEWAGERERRMLEPPYHESRFNRPRLEE